MEPLRIALAAGIPNVERLLRDENRGITWELAASPEEGADYVFANELVRGFEGKTLSIVDADLSLPDRPYANTRDAIFAGESETRSSVYVLTREPLRGPLFLLSAPFPVARMALDARAHRDADFLDEYADLHRRWMISMAWPEMLMRTIELLAAGTTKVVGDIVWIDGAPGACRMGESPAICHETDVKRGIPRSCPLIG